VTNSAQTRTAMQTARKPAMGSTIRRLIRDASTRSGTGTSGDPDTAKNPCFARGNDSLRTCHHAVVRGAVFAPSPQLASVSLKARSNAFGVRLGVSKSTWTRPNRFHNRRPIRDCRGVNSKNSLRLTPRTRATRAAARWAKIITGHTTVDVLRAFRLDIRHHCRIADYRPEHLGFHRLSGRSG
jgi:hypothetical protein